MTAFLMTWAALILLGAVGRGIWGDIKFHRTHGWDALRRPSSDESQPEQTYASVTETATSAPSEQSS